MEIHYLINSTMEALANSFFLPSLTSDFVKCPHVSEIATSGNFGEDNYGELMIERTRLIVEDIKMNLDEELVLWSDADIVFFQSFSDELERLATGKDLLFQFERDEGRPEACFGFQIIRRNIDTLIFYSRLLMLQRSSDDPHDQSWGNELLLMQDSPRWGLLPVEYSSELNGGLSINSRIYHANCTPFNSIATKQDLLKQAVSYRLFLMNNPI